MADYHVTANLVNTDITQTTVISEELYVGADSPEEAISIAKDWFDENYDDGELENWEALLCDDDDDEEE